MRSPTVSRSHVLVAVKDFLGQTRFLHTKLITRKARGDHTSIRIFLKMKCCKAAESLTSQLALDP